MDERGQDNATSSIQHTVMTPYVAPKVYMAGAAATRELSATDKSKQERGQLIVALF